MKRWEMFVLIEFVALLIGFVMPVTPSKSGAADWSPAELLFAEPSYFENVVVYFVLAHLVIAVLGALLVALTGGSDHGDSSGEGPGGPGPRTIG